MDQKQTRQSEFVNKFLIPAENNRVEECEAIETFTKCRSITELKLNTKPKFRKIRCFF